MHENSNCSRSDGANSGPQKAAERETDAHRITQRLKQIEYGKNTLGYARYCAEVPRCGWTRHRDGTAHLPSPGRRGKRPTPTRQIHTARVASVDLRARYACDLWFCVPRYDTVAQVKKWRRLLHEWDPAGEGSGDDGDGDALGRRKRGRDKPCSPDENTAPKRQTLSGGAGDDDLYGGTRVY